MAFLKPGSVSRGAFGISFDVDKESNPAEGVFVFNRSDHLGIKEQRGRLPIASHRPACLYAVKTRQVTIIVGETGCGKSTQLPQFLLEVGWAEDGMAVAVTQPRRVAAMTVSLRVAEETNTRLGELVGYSIRFEDVSTPGKTKLKFLTDGMLLREMMEDPLLSKYSVIIVDEAHERSISTDVLLGLLRKVLSRRPSLRLVIASATMEAEKIQKYFDMRSSRVHYLEEPTADYVKECVATVEKIHLEDTPGDILVFLTGQNECERAAQMIKDGGLKPSPSGLQLLPVALYSGLPSRDQLTALQVPPRKFRKVVCATNIAETSVTIDGVVFVIDCCFAKFRSFNPYTGMDALITSPISKASAKQRAGRAGRVRPGHCFRICTQDAFDSSLRAATVPEIQRCDLTQTVSQLKAMGVDNLMKFKWIDPPPSEAMVRALEHLHALGVLDDDARLSCHTGLKICEMPLDAPMAKCLLVSGDLGCSIEMAIIAAMLSVHRIWAPHKGHRRSLERSKDRFAVAEGDLITYVNIFRAWVEEGKSSVWCQKNHVSHKALLRASDIHSQLILHMQRTGIPILSSKRDLTPVLQSIASGLCMNVAVYQGMEITKSGLDVGVYRLARMPVEGEDGVKLVLHPSSILHRCRPEVVVFHSVQQDDFGWYCMQDVSVVEAVSLPRLLPHLYQMGLGRGAGGLVNE